MNIITIAFFGLLIFFFTLLGIKRTDKREFLKIRNKFQIIILILLLALFLSFINNISISGNRTLLQWASWNGYTWLARISLLIGAEVDKKDGIGLTALYGACSNGNADIVTMLAEAGANVNFLSDHGNSLLHKACYWKKIDVVKALINAKADINIRNNNGDTPLIYTLDRYNNNPSSLSIIKTLIAAGANPNETDLYGANSLLNLYKTKPPSLELVDILLKAGADPNKEDYYGETILSKIISHYLYNISKIEKDHDQYFKLVQLLLNNGADPNQKMSKSMSDPLNFSIYMYNSLLRQDEIDYASKIYKLIRLLLKSGANPNNQESIFQRTSLNYAIYSDWIGPKLIRLLIDKGANLEIYDYSGMTPLHNAVDPYGNKKKIIGKIKVLLEKGADVNAKTKNCACETPLHFAARIGNKEMIKLLLSYGANPNIKNNKGQNAIAVALENNYNNIANLISSFKRLGK